MKARSKAISPFFISVAAVITASAVIIVGALSLWNSKIVFSCEYFFICYTVRDNALSADAISETVSSYGGAGYVLEYGGDYYVTVACYYTESDANKIQQSLLRRGLDCLVLKIETNEYPIQSLGARGNEELFRGNLNTLFSLSRLCYDCANGLDTGEYNQGAAQSVLGDVQSGLNGLKFANVDNCFSAEIKRLIAECDSINGGYIYSKDMRKLQIAIADTVINIQLY